jgi:hypothetical protein
MALPARLSSAVVRHLSWKKLDSMEATRLHFWEEKAVGMLVMRKHLNDSGVESAQVLELPT